MDLTKFCLRFFAAFVFFVHFCSEFSWTTAAPVISSEIQAMMYLQKYGYMNESSSNSASLISQEAVSSAIKDFQRFAGLAETGELDNRTLTMMNMPRCGVRDKVGHSGSARRRKRYALQGSKWRVTDLTYRISKYPRRLKDRQKVDKEIAKAFKVWSDVTSLKFINSDKSRVHIDIRFEEGEHGDGERFDGPGRTLAHAFFPQYGGDAHFDDEEKWTINQYYGTNLFQVAAHEFGHSLGLSHSDVKASLMAPFYRGYEPTFELDEDDILGIQALYGRPRKESPSPTPGTKPRAHPDISGAPDLCQDSAFDAATRTEDGKTYVFKGNYYWEIQQSGIADGYPRKISTDWSGLPGDLDAALTWTNGKTFFFKKNQYWRFRNKKMDSGYPKDISVGFEGIPDNIDAAFVWSGNGKTYFLKGENYWRFDSRSEPPVSTRYPQAISNWEGLPNNIDAALQWSNQKTYFFKGRVYYRFNDRSFSVDKADPSYPRSTSVWWFDCQSASSEDMSKASLTGGDQKAIYVGGHSSFHDESTIHPSGVDYVDEETVDGSEKQDVELQNGEETGTPFPRQEALDGNSANLLSSTSFYTSFITAYIVYTIRIRFL